MKYIRINKIQLLFVLLLLLPERIFFLVNQDRFQSIFHIKYSDFVMYIYFGLFIYLLLHYRTNSFEKYYFTSNIIQIVPLVLLGTIVPMVLFGQAFSAGFWIQKNFYMLIFSYYIFRTLLVEKIFTTEYIWSLLYKISFILTGALIIQHAICNYIQILSVGYSKRFGVRITDNFTYSTILLIGSLILYFAATCKKEKIISIIGLLMAYYHCVLVSQTRIVMIGYGVLTIMMALLYRNRTIKKITYLFIIVGLLLIALQSDLGQYLISAMSDSSTDPSAQIREIGKAYYFYEIIKSPLVGRGYPGCYEAYLASGSLDHIFLNDNGLFGFAYIYGILGLIWYLIFTIKMLMCSFKAFKMGEYRFILFTIFLQVICANIIYWYWKFSFGVIFSIMLAMMEEYRTKILEPKVRIFY